MFLRDDFVAAIDAKREAAGLSWRDVAKEAGVSPSTLSRLTHSAPDMATFAKLAAWLGADIRPFFAGSHGSRASNASEVRRLADAAYEAIAQLRAATGGGR